MVVEKRRRKTLFRATTKAGAESGADDDESDDENDDFGECIAKNRVRRPIRRQYICNSSQLLVVAFRPPKHTTRLDHRVQAFVVAFRRCLSSLLFVVAIRRCYSSLLFVVAHATLLFVVDFDRCCSCSLNLKLGVRPMTEFSCQPVGDV